MVRETIIDQQSYMYRRLILAQLFADFIKVYHFSQLILGEELKKETLLTEVNKYNSCSNSQHHFQVLFQQQQQIT